MSDIFISYASADRARARALAARLEREGWSVWWDRKIPPGQSFSHVLEEALNSARCVVVLWSPSSVASDWVQTEAAEGKRKDILVPALIEAAALPLEFRRIQAANLVDWDETLASMEFDQLLAAIRAVLGDVVADEATGPGPSPEPAPAPPVQPSPPKHSIAAEARPLLATLMAWGRVTAMAVAIALIFVTLFRSAYPETPVTEALSVIAIVAIVLATAMNYCWIRWIRKRPKR